MASVSHDAFPVSGGNDEAAASSVNQVPAGDGRVDLVRQLLAGRPLAPHAAHMVAAADANGVDWRLMPVISILESSGGAAACGGNAWGYANCAVRFGSFEEGINTVAATLARSPYAGRSTAVQLCIWVSGNFCTSHHAVNYVYRASGLYRSLGGSFALPAWIAPDGETAADSASSDEDPAPVPTQPLPTATVPPPEPTTTPAPTEPAAAPTMQAPPAEETTDADAE